MSSLNVYEARVVLSGRGPRGRARFPSDPVDRFLARLQVDAVEIVPFDPDQVVLAHEAHLRFGRGFHPAVLSFADCAAYALAKLRGEPLPFKGDDFSRTDITPALAPRAFLRPRAAAAPSGRPSGGR
ncbi:type II toxin-antitoxin system VapC family toxin [Benzoatithermus flavus]|uniref:type II toxin-antitoxin system VapC family toxin n=1 Tax=Benzoatithermus flavus TaxID=3108223 RepID=UPI003AAA996D